LQAAQIAADQPLDKSRLQSLSFQPFANKQVVDFGEGTRRQIIKLRLGTPKPELSSRSEGYVLLVSPPYVESVEHYLLNDSGQPVLDKRLSRVEYDNSLFYTPSHYAFEIGPHDLTKTHFLVVDNFSPYPLELELVDAKTFRAQDFKAHTLFVVIYTLIIALALVNLIFYVFLRKSSYLFYSLYVVTFLVTLLWQEGWAAHSRTLLLFAFGDYGYFLLSTLVGLSAWLFLLSFIGPTGISPRLRKIVLVWVALFFVLLAIEIIAAIVGVNLHGHFFQLKQGMVLIGLISGILTVLVSFYAWRRGNRQAGFLFLAWTVMMIAVSFRMSYDLHPAPDAFWRAHALEVGLLFEALILFMGLADQTMVFMRQRDSARKNYSHARRSSAHQKALNDFIHSSQAVTQSGTDSQQVIAGINDQFLALVNQVVPVKGLAVLSLFNNQIEAEALSPDELTLCLSEIVESERHELMRGLNRHEPVEFWKACEDWEQIGHFLLVPVSSGAEQPQALLLVLAADAPVDKSTCTVLEDFLKDAWHALQNALQLHDLASDARFDPLTQVLNRRSIDAELTKTLENHRTDDSPFCLGFIDLDYFKDINDTYGHQTGDECLQYFADLLKTCLPAEAIIGRYGGDEFLVIFPGSQAAESKNWLHNFLQKLVNSPWGEAKIRFSSSMGIAEYQQGMEDAQTLVRFADRALYHSKRNGRCQITVYDR
jgi:diguanylate cyclase (GGDEF)-like protein